MKKVSIVLLVVIIMFVSSPVLATEQPIRILIDNEIVYSDAPPIIISNRVLVPVRVVSEKLGYLVSWHEDEQAVYIKKDDVSIKFIIGQKKMWINGNEKVLDVMPVVKNGRSYLPIRVVAECISANVVWDGGTSSVIVKTGKESVSVSSIENVNLLDEQKVSFFSNGATLNNFNIFQLDSPSRLVIDFDQMLVEELQLPELIENGLIKEVRYSQYELNPNVVRVVLDLNCKVDYTYELVDGSLVLSLKPHIYRVVLDSGHGGKDSGAIGVSGTYEKDLNLALTLKLANLLKDEPLIEVILTRDTDVYVELIDRVEFANSVNPDIFISIHHNSIPYKSTIHGTETYYTRSDSYVLTKTIHKNLVMSTGFTDRGIDTEDFKVTKYTDMPATLIEVGYMSNRVEEQTMKDPYFQDNVARGLEKGIKEYFGLSE
ncbi:MAG: N-acetylmuramoyl-L-alanine amidase [Vulcanibacillus sp.]